MGVSSVFQTSKHDALVGDEAFDAVEMAGRVGVKNNATERKKLVEDKDVSTTDVVVGLKTCHRSFLTTQQDLHGPPMSILKLANLW